MKKNKLPQSAILALSCAALPFAAQGEILYGLSQNTLFSFDSASPGFVGAPLPVTGLQGESLIGIDIRPENGSLFGLGSNFRLYDINPSTGVASLINPTPFGSSGAAAFGLDFNPVPDAVRVVTTDAQNFRVSPTGSLLAQDGTLAYAVNDPNFGLDPRIVAAGYANNNPNATTTTLFGIDSSTDAVVTILPPNAGVVNTLGLLGVNTTDEAAFDISGVTGLAYASLTRPGQGMSELYQIDLTTGSASLLGEIGFAGTLDGLTVSVVPEPSTWALLGLGAFGLLARRLKLKGRSKTV